MAKATRVKPVVTNILLELTPEEALSLATVCGGIAGDGRRKHTSDIGAALATVGIESLGVDAYEGQIEFNN